MVSLGSLGGEVAVAGPVECRILGPFEVVVDGVPLRMGGVRPQALFAALLLDVGQTVSIERLVTAVWGDAPPSSVRSQVSIHVSALRKALGAVGHHDVIETVQGGYRVCQEGVTVDALEFERAVDDARGLTERGDTAGAVQRYCDALDRWRGPPLVDLDSDAFTAPAARWEELRLAAVEERAELRLDLDGHREAVVELAPLVAEHPFRERLRAQLMRALARGGRAAEALDTYREGSRLLREQLGLRPGSELRDAEQWVLSGDLGTPPTTRPTPAAAPRPSVVVPAQLPGDLGTFTGRGADVVELAALVSAREHLAVAIAGPGGIGKSTLAVHVAHEVADRFPDGQLYVNLHGATPDTKPLASGEVLAEFLRTLGVATADLPADEEEAVRRYRDLTDGKRLLVVLDNAADTTQVERLLPGGSTCATLLTSRRRLDGLASTAHRQLDVLTADEALAMLTRIAGEDRIAAEPDAAASVVERCGRLPLALAIAGARIAARRSGIGVLADRLAKERRRLGELAVDDQDVRASFQVSYADLEEPGAGRMFRMLGLLDGPDLGVDVAAALTDVPTRRAETLLDQLCAAQLVVSDASGRYRMHDLLRLFAREKATDEEDAGSRSTALRRALHWYAGSASNAAMLLAPAYAWRLEIAPVELEVPGVALRTVEQVNVWVEAERENLLAAARQAVAIGDPGLALTFAAALDVPFEHRGRWRDQLVISEVATDAARRTEDPLHLGLAYNDIGWASATLGRAQEAARFLELALDHWRSAGHGEGEALSTHGLGTTLRSMGRHEEALTYLRRAGELARRIGNNGREATCLSASGLTYGRLGRLTEAIDAHRRSVELARRSDSWRTVVIALGNLGEAYRLAGEAEHAVATFREALEVGRARDYGGTYWEAEHLWGLGRSLSALGIGGRDCWNASARILCDLGLIGPDDRAAIERDPLPATPGVIDRQL